MRDLTTEEDIARARQDPVFRQKLLAQNLDRLLEALNKMRKTSVPDPDTARQMREGVDLAVMLADRLHETDIGPDTEAA
jgi:hypothetical protein